MCGQPEFDPLTPTPHLSVTDWSCSTVLEQTSSSAPGLVFSLETEEKEADRTRLGEKNLLTIVSKMKIWSFAGSKISRIPKNWIKKRVDLWAMTKLTSLGMVCNFS